LASGGSFRLCGADYPEIALGGLPCLVHCQAARLGGLNFRTIGRKSELRTNWREVELWDDCPEVERSRCPIEHFDLTSGNRFARLIDEGHLDCRFDERTGIMHVYLGNILLENIPTPADILELFAHRRKGRPIKGIIIFP